MRRSLARWQTWWLRAFVLTVLAAPFLPGPWGAEVAAMVGFGALAFVRPPRGDRGPVAVRAPVRGRWVALNSPGTAVPSHGVRSFAQAYAVDVLHPLPPGSPTSVGWRFTPRRPEEFSCFGAPVYAVADGVVVMAHDRRRDHGGRDSWPTLLFVMVVEGFCREVGGARRLLGNHVVIEHPDGVFSLVAHLRRHSVRVRTGDRVSAGELLAEVGNTGNSSEPHLHVQLMDRARPTAAAGVPFRWTDLEMQRGDIDPTRTRTPEVPDVVPGLPANGQVFSAG